MGLRESKVVDESFNQNFSLPTPFLLVYYSIRELAEPIL